MTQEATTETGWREGGSHRPLALTPGVAAIVRRGSWDVFARRYDSMGRALTTSTSRFSPAWRS